MSEISADTRLPPGPSPEVRLDSSFPDGTLPMLVDLFHKFGDVYKLRSINRDPYVYVVSHPNDASYILGKNYRNYIKGVGIERVNVLLGRGLMVSEGDLWKRQRKMIQPMFHRDVLEDFFNLTVKCSELLLASWQAKRMAGESINLTAEMSQATLDFMLFVLFSGDLDHLIEHYGHNPFDIITDESARDLMFARKFRVLAKDVLGIVEARREKNRRPYDIVSLLIDVREKKSGQPMPDKLLVDEVLTLVIAGHETTAAALNWTWYLVSQHPDVESQMHDELDRILSGRVPSFDDLAKLVYTRQVIEEAMRLYPPGWLLTRRALAEDEISGFHVPAGTDVFVSPYIIHRHPEFWRQPESFKPERFAPEHSNNRPQGAYLAFSMGVRNCIGEAMAMYEMVTQLAIIGQQLKLEYIPQHSLELDAKVNLRPKHNLYMMIKER